MSHMLKDTLQDWLTLSFLAGLGSTRISRLVGEFGSPAEVLAAEPDRLGKVEGIGSALVRMFSDRSCIERARKQAARELIVLAEKKIELVTFDDHRYPPSLRTIYDPPVLLYCRGDALLLGQPAVAIVGSRAASSYGKRISYELAAGLARRGICVVSGLALGVDGEAHLGALAAAGATVGVLGCGIDEVYPRQHANLFSEIARHGLLVSEYPLGARPEGFRFPERNRIISGLALGVVVVEASLRSGSLITASLALEQGREVFAVPGRIDSAKSQGCHRLLQQGAKLVNSVDDILEELSLTAALPDRTQAGPDCDMLSSANMSKAEQQLLGCLEVYPVTIDEIVRQSGHPPAEIIDLLMRLELKGMIRQLPGQQYERLAGGVR